MATRPTKRATRGPARVAIRSSFITRNRKDTVRNSLETPGPAGRDVGSIPTVQHKNEPAKALFAGTRVQTQFLARRRKLTGFFASAHLSTAIFATA